MSNIVRGNAILKTSTSSVERETLKLGRDVMTTTDTGRTEVKVEIFIYVDKPYVKNQRVITASWTKIGPTFATVVNIGVFTVFNKTLGGLRTYCAMRH